MIVGGNLTPRPTPGSPPRSPGLPASPVERCRGRPARTTRAGRARLSYVGTGRPRANQAAVTRADRRPARGPAACPHAPAPAARNTSARAITADQAIITAKPSMPHPRHLTTPSYAGGSNAVMGRPGQVARRTFPPFGYKTAPGIEARPDRGSTAAHCAVLDPRSPIDALWGYNRRAPAETERTGFMASAPASPPAKGTFLSRGRGTGPPARR